MNNYKLKPYVLGLRTTEKCNVNCFHCSLSAQNSGQEIDLNIARNAIAEAFEYGIGLIHFSGGEPLLYTHLFSLVSKCSEIKVAFEITTSCFTHSNNDNSHILEYLKDNGCFCVMLSYDDAHAIKVPVEQLVLFVKKALSLNLRLSLFIIEDEKMKINVNSIRHSFIQHKINTSNINFCRSTICFTGRATTLLSKELELYDESSNFPRCPYVLTVPTIIPSGEFTLCPCASLSSRKFVLGKYPNESVYEILSRYENAIEYKFLSKHGPQKALHKIGIRVSEIPSDMCQACNLYLKLIEIQEYVEELRQISLTDNLDILTVDYEALLKPHKYYLDNMINKIR